MRYKVSFRLWEEIDPPVVAGIKMQLFYCLDEPLGLVLVDRGIATDARLFKVFPIGEPEEIARMRYDKDVATDNILRHFAQIYEPKLRHANRK